MQSSPVVKHRLCLPFLIVAAVASSGCAVEDPMLGEDELEIVNGQPTSGHPSVVRVMVPAGGWCTGVLITHSSVLTAAHCVTNGAMTVTDVFTGVATVHPDYDGELNDIAVVSTFDKVGRPWHARLAPAVAAGQDITLVGFGRTGFGIPQDNIKRFGTNTIDRLDANFLYFDTDLTAPPPTDAATCFGDSGGPAFLGNTNCIGGITKSQDGATLANACTANEGEWYHTRTDAHLVWLENVTRDPLTICP